MAQALDRAATGSATITLQESTPSPPPATAVTPPSPQVITIHLRRKKSVKWQDGTIDNEFLNKRSSKKCCIFHKEKPFDEDCSDDDDEHHDHCAHDRPKGACSDSQHASDSGGGSSNADR